MSVASQEAQAAHSSTRDHRFGIEDRMAAPMFGLSLLFLVLLAALHQLTRGAEEMPWDWRPVQIVVGAMFLLWPIFLLEETARYFFTPRRRRTWQTLGWSVAIGLIPPLRMGAHSRTRPGHLWLPWMGWRQIDYDLNKKLENAFAAPMLLMALLILPVLAVEYFWAEAIEGRPVAQTLLGIAIAVIWLAFAIEFVIRCSAAEKKLRYALEHWVDVAVVILPMVEFLPFLRLLRVTRIMRVQNFARMAKYYRLYGVAGKGWRGIVVLQVIQRAFSRKPGARVSRLRSHLDSVQDQIKELEREADYYRREIQALEPEAAKEAHQNDQ
jgi:hypothetical protein